MFSKVYVSCKKKHIKIPRNLLYLVIIAYLLSILLLYGDYIKSVDFEIFFAFDISSRSSIYNLHAYVSYTNLNKCCH